MDVDGANVGVGTAGPGAQERAAGFVSITEPGIGPPSQKKSRTPFMPTPRKRPVRPIVPVSSPAWTKRPEDFHMKPLSDSTMTNVAGRMSPQKAPVHTPVAGPRVVRAAVTPDGPHTAARQAKAPSMRATRPATSLSLSRPVPPQPATSLAASRTDGPVPQERPASPALSPMPPIRPVDMVHPSQAMSPARTVRAKVTEGIIPNRHRNHEARATPKPRVERRAGSPLRRIPRPPLPDSRIDILSLQHQVSDSSFVLEQDDTQATDAVQVHVRLRPTHPNEECAWVTPSGSASLMLDPSISETKMQPNLGMPFYFDHVHTGSSNANVYATLARPLVHSALHGYNALIFAYGQTASGKTFTLSGDDDGREPGMIPRAVNDLFQGICQGSAQREYLIRVSYLEIWNEIVRDLLEPTNQPHVRDDRRRGANAVLVAPLHEEVVTSPAGVFKLLARGEANRHMGATDWNERSSRSHTCFKITIESWDREPSAMRPYRVSELSLIDLAGSERHSTHTSQRRTEGGNINKSLLSLGKVIFALSEKNVGHVPYRDSKLTRILQNSLSGRARIAVVCTLNPSPAMVEESLGTLNFARRIKHVRVRASINEFEGDMSALDESHALLARYREEMGTLRAQVARLEAHKSRESQPLTVEALQSRLDELGALILPGGQAPPESEVSHPISPTKQRGFTFDDPLPVVQEKLHAALQKIQRLERQLAARLSLPMSASNEKDERIQYLLQRIQELETVCEAQTVDAPQAIREDVELEWLERVEAAEAATRKREAFLAEISAECARLRRANEALVRLAHAQTSSMVTQLAERQDAPRAPPVLSIFAPRLRPATVLGTQRAQAAPDISIDDESSGRLSSSDIDDLLLDAE